MARRQLNIMISSAKTGRALAVMKALVTSPSLASVCDMQVFPIDITPAAAGLYFKHSPGTVLPRLEDNPTAWENFIVEHNIGVIFPTSDLDLHILSQYRDEWWERLSCKVMVDSLDSVIVANDKAGTFSELHHAGVNTPESYSRRAGLEAFAQFYQYPYIVKPRFGANSRGINIAHNDEELKFYWNHTENPIVQEYIEGDEYSGAITYDKHGQAQAFFVTRVYERRGHMTFGEVGDYPQIEAFLREFAEKTRHLGFSHALNVQMIERDGIVYVIELNPVCSGSTAIRAAFGFNQPEQLILHHCFGQEINQPEIKHGLAFSITDEVYLYDTTLEQIKQSTNGIFIKKALGL